MINSVKQLGLLTMLLGIFFALPAYAQDPVGKITYLKGQVDVVDVEGVETMELAQIESEIKELIAEIDKR